MKLGNELKALLMSEILTVTSTDTQMAGAQLPAWLMKHSFRTLSFTLGFIHQ